VKGSAFSQHINKYNDIALPEVTWVGYRSIVKVAFIANDFTANVRGLDVLILWLNIDCGNLKAIRQVYIESDHCLLEIHFDRVLIVRVIVPQAIADAESDLRCDLSTVSAIAINGRIRNICSLDAQVKVGIPLSAATGSWIRVPRRERADNETTCVEVVCPINVVTALSNVIRTTVLAFKAVIDAIVHVFVLDKVADFPVEAELKIGAVVVEGGILDIPPLG
jgi:hypothetical protein